MQLYGFTSSQHNLFNTMGSDRIRAGRQWFFLSRWDGLGSMDEVEKAFKLGKQTVREDVRHITGEYLINNVDLAFKM
jgi:hypothetical protein